MKVISAGSTWYVRKLFIMVRQNEDQIVLVSRNVTVLGQVCKNVTEALKKERERERGIANSWSKKSQIFLSKLGLTLRNSQKSQQIRNAFSYIERKRKQKRHEI